MRPTGQAAGAARGARLIVAVALLGLGTSNGGCERPPLHVRRTGTTFVIDVQTLGEYKTSVRRIRLTRGREVVWEVMARDRTLQLHTIGLRIGPNPGAPQSCGGGQPTACDTPEADDRFVVITPASGTFRLEPGNEYELELWGSGSRWSRASTRLSP
jgi:hypothetical protein